MLNHLRGRLVKALGGAPGAEIPRELESHRLAPVLVAAARRPVKLQEVQDQLAALWTARTAGEVEGLLEDLVKSERTRSLARNLFVAAVRVGCEKELNRGLALADRFLHRIPDQRAIRSLVRPQVKAGNHLRALALLELVEPGDWVDHWRPRVEKKLRRAEWRPERNLIHHPGYLSLQETPPPALLLYGDLNMNLIDGSSIWLASFAEALSGCGLDVHILLKWDIERTVVLDRLVGRPGVRLIEPSEAGLPTLTSQEAVDTIEALDGLQGGYEHIILRGMIVSNLAASKKTLWKRVTAYLTDFYRVDGDPPKVVIPDDSRSWFADFAQLFQSFLVQTPALGAFMARELHLTSDKVVSLPPMLPDALVESPPPHARRAPGAPLRIGYAGKISPRWGVLELVATCEALAARGLAVEAHIIGDKVYPSTDSFPTFEEDATRALSSPVVTWHKGLTRSATLEAMAGMDLAWCYRDPILELHTMELSTKLLECMALGVPILLLRSAANEELLGRDYPLFVDDPGQLEARVEEMIDGRAAVDFAAARWRDQVKSHAISAIRTGSLVPMLSERVRSPAARKIVLAGHDLKFIGELESHLKRLGHIVKRDDWEWGRPGDEARSKQLVQWADVVVCEWALANAVWYSERLPAGKRLVVRLHNQEVRQRGRVFPPRIAIDRVDAMVFVSDESRKRAVEQFGWRDDRLTTIPNFVNVDLFARAKKPEAHRTVAIVGIIPKLKRLDRALDLIAALRKQDPAFRLLIKGHLPADLPWLGSRKDELPYFDRELGRIDSDPLLEGGVVLDEFEPRLAAFYQQVGFVLSPSDLESFHYAVAEGAASGAIPVVWPWEGADLHYPTEWIVSGDAEARTRILGLAAESPEARALRGNECRAFIRERYDLSVILPRLTSIILG